MLILNFNLFFPKVETNATLPAPPPQFAEGEMRECPESCLGSCNEAVNHWCSCFCQQCGREGGLRKAKRHTQGHTARKWLKQRHDSPGSLSNAGPSSAQKWGHRFGIRPMLSPADPPCTFVPVASQAFQQCGCPASARAEIPEQ